MITGGLIPFQTNSRLLASNLTLNEARIILDYTIIQRETIDSERKFPISIKKRISVSATRTILHFDSSITSQFIIL